MKRLTDPWFEMLCRAPETGDGAASDEVAVETGAEVDTIEPDKAPASLISQAADEGIEESETDPENLLDQVPEEGAYDFSDLDLPEGMELDEKLAETAGPIMAEAGLTQRQANHMTDVIVAMKRQEAEQWGKTQEDWQAQVKADKEIGGDKFERTAKQCGRVMKQFGTAEFGTFLDNFGLGNHPEMIRFMARVGNAITEDEPGGSASVGGKEDAASILYPND